MLYREAMSYLGVKTPLQAAGGEKLRGILRLAQDDRRESVQSLREFPCLSLNITYLFAGTSARLGIRAAVAIPLVRPGCKSYSRRSWRSAGSREGSGPTNLGVLINASTGRLSWSTPRRSGTDA